MRTVFMSAIIATSISTVPLSLSAQSDSAWSDALPELLSESQEIALARSAAPANVSDDATVYLLRRGGYEVGVEGTNGVECYVSRSRAESLEPHCFDAEGARTILQMQLRRSQLREEGISGDEIDAVIAEGIADGTFKLPMRPAMSYMMSSAQHLISDDGRDVGNWMPHIMIYVPYITSEQMGLFGEPSIDAAIVVDGGKPTANVMIVVREFVDPKATS